MRTKIDEPLALFIFAHQDDEFGVFAQIEHELRSGRNVRCIYATDGAVTVSAEVREAESCAVLQKLGVPQDSIMFVGRELGIPDGQLYLHVAEFARWLTLFVESQEKLEVCFLPAWEGGHPDHDLAHAIAVELLVSRKCVVRIWQYPLYHGRHCSGPFFRLMSTIPENGPTSRLSIAWRDRVRYVLLCLAYPSQWRTWIGLFPFACIHYLCRGLQQLQSVSRDRLSQPPHARPLYYERRGFLDWSVLRQAIVECELFQQKNAKTSNRSGG